MWTQKKTMVCTTLILIHYKHTWQYFFTYVRGNMSGDMRHCLTHHSTINLNLLNQHTVHTVPTVQWLTIFQRKSWLMSTLTHTGCFNNRLAENNQRNFLWLLSPDVMMMTICVHLTVTVSITFALWISDTVHQHCCST